MVQVYEELQKLQWIKGDKAGTVEEVIEQDNEWTKFKSGSRISTNLINEFMLLVDGEPLDINQVNDDNQKENHSNIKQSKENHTAAKNNPIKLLFDKQKKTDDIQLNIEFLINVPTTDIFNILSITFDEKEVVEELTQFISNQIDNELIKSKLNESIKQLINNRYKS